MLTVGASSTNGTLDTRTTTRWRASAPRVRRNIDFGAKPDLVAPGAGTVSLAAAGSMFYSTKAQFLVGGKIGQIGFKPYLTLSGTSMAAPVVSGTVALMLQANPNLTPNLVKAILQYTAQVYPGYNSLRQGAGFLNSLGAVRLAQVLREQYRGLADAGAVGRGARQILWGNHRISGGYINPRANAWANSVVWGAARALDGDNIIWGTDCPDSSCDNIIWGTDDALDNIIWGTDDARDNIIWGTAVQRRQHHLGHRRRRQHHLGQRLRRRRLRQHHLGHR